MMWSQFIAYARIKARFHFLKMTDKPQSLFMRKQKSFTKRRKNKTGNQFKWISTSASEMEQMKKVSLQVMPGETRKTSTWVFSSVELLRNCYFNFLTVCLPRRFLNWTMTLHVKSGIFWRFIFIHRFIVKLKIMSSIKRIYSVVKVFIGIG